MKAKILINYQILAENLAIEIDFVSKVSIPAEVQPLIEKTWKDLLEQGKNIWENGKGLRLESFETINQKLVLKTTIIDFKSRIGLQKNIDTIANMGFDLLCKGLAIGGLVETIDKKFIFIKRNLNSISGQKFGFIGGIIDNLQSKSGLDLIEHNYKEIREEIGIKKDLIDKISIHGIVQGSGGNVIIVTKTKLTIDSKQIQFEFQKKEDDEAIDIEIVDSAELYNFLEKIGSYGPLLKDLNL